MALVRGKWLENVDRTHLVLSTGKQVLQKKKEREFDLTGIGGTTQADALFCAGFGVGRFAGPASSCFPAMGQFHCGTRPNSRKRSPERRFEW